MKVQQLICDGDADGSRAAMRIAMYMVNADLGLHYFVQAMTDRGNGCSQWYFDMRDGRAAGVKTRKSARGPDKAERELIRTWNKARALVAAYPARRLDVSDVIERTDSAWSFAWGHLTGRSRLDHLKVLLAILEDCIAYQTARPLLPVRKVALLAGVSEGAAHKALGALAGAGVLRWDGATGQGAGIYEVVRCLPAEQTPLTERRGKPVHPRDFVGLDIWRRSDLGAAGMFVYLGLDEEETLIASVVEAAGVPRSTTYKKLRALGERGLAAQSEPGGGWRRGPQGPATASRFPTSDSPARRAVARHAEDRQRHKGRRLCAECGVLHDRPFDGACPSCGTTRAA